MSLLTDTPIPLERLVAIDSAITTIAEAESLVVEGDGGLIQQSLSESIQYLLRRIDVFGDSTWYNPQAVLNAGLGGGARSQVSATQIVLTDSLTLPSALGNWIAYRALMSIYRSASHRVKEDLYEKKIKTYAAAAEEMWKTLWSRGLPIVWRPLPCPGTLERGFGMWYDANLTDVAGGNGAAQTIRVAVTWVDGTLYQSSSDKRNGESGPSPTLRRELGAGRRAVVAIDSLVPPAGGLYRPEPDQNVPLLAGSGWNVYVGADSGPLYLQNSTPVPVATKTYTILAPNFTGAQLDPGQIAETRLRFTNMVQRG